MRGEHGDVSRGTVPPSDLRVAYEAARYEVQFPEGVLTLTQAGCVAGNLAWLGDSSLTVVTAYNPGRQRPGFAANQAAQARLADELTRAGRAWCAAINRAADGDHAEPSFGVLGLSPRAARELGRRHRQAAVFYWQAGRGRLLWCDASIATAAAE